MVFVLFVLFICGVYVCLFRLFICFFGVFCLFGFVVCFICLFDYLFCFISWSVRDGDTVKHYRIRQLDEGGFFIARRVTFLTLANLVEHYSQEADGLCVNLKKPCSQVRTQKHARKGEIR